MQRLTYEDMYGKARVLEKELPNSHEKLTANLAAYERTGLTPEEITQLQAERDAAMIDIDKHCHTCKYLDKDRNGCGRYSPIDDIDTIRRCCNETKEGWQWRGLEEATNGQR